MGDAGLPHILVDSESEIPSAAKWNDNYDFLNLAPHNLIRNGDMEEFISGTPAYWTLAGAGAACTSDATAKRGSYSAKVTYGAAPAYIEQAAVDVVFTKGRTAKAWVWVKCSTPNVARIEIADGVGTTQSAYHTGGGAWELLSVEHDVAAGATTLKLRLRVEAAGNALFDVASLVDFYEIRGHLPDPSMFNDAAAGAWVIFSGSDGTIAASYNITSVTRDDVGKYTIVFARDFASADYIISGSIRNADYGFIHAKAAGMAAGQAEVYAVKHDGTLIDATAIMVVFHGRLT